MTANTHKSYRGHRDVNGTCHVLVVQGRQSRELDQRLDLRNHSPTGFEWGYGGSGPAQLALALAADLLDDDDYALSLYQRLKFKVVGRLPRDRWELTDDQLCTAIAEILVADQDEEEVAS